MKAQRMERRVIDEFDAKSGTGKKYLVIEYQEFDIILTGGKTNETAGLKTWATSTGKPVKQLMTQRIKSRLPKKSHQSLKNGDLGKILSVNPS